MENPVLFIYNVSDIKKVQASGEAGKSPRNMFSVVWMPRSEGGQLASGAGDYRVCLADVEAGR